MIDIDSFTIPVMAMKTKEALLLLPHSGFPWDGAKKGTDRTYARPDALAHSKKRGFQYIWVSPDPSYGYENKRSPLILVFHGMGLKKALTAPMQGRMLSPTQKREVFNIYGFLPIPVMAMKTKEALLLLPYSGFPWHGAKKGTDRTYARTDALAHSKKRGFHFIYQLHIDK